MTDPAPEPNPEADIEAELAKMEAELAEIQTEIAPSEEAEKAITDEAKRLADEYQQKLNEIRAEQMRIRDEAYSKRTKLREFEREVERKRRELENAKRAREALEREIRRNEELAKLNERWDKLTLAAQWREHAKPHQIAAGHTITENRKVILADPMGLGKTLSAIITCDMAEAGSRMASPKFPFLGEEINEYRADGTYGPVIVNGIERPVGKRVIYFCPSSLIRNVEKEFRLWANHRNIIYIGGMSKTERQFAFDTVLKDRPEFVVIVNYEAWRKDLSLIERLANLDPDVVIIDEAHNIKDIKSIAYRGVKQLLDTANPEYVIPMTGTPILNRPQELFSLLTLVNPREFYYLNDFLYMFCEQDDYGFWKFQPGGLDRIARKIRKNFLRRTRDQAGIVLPEKTIINHDLVVDTEAYPLQAKVRDDMAKYYTIVIDAEKGQAISAAVKIAVFTRLRQIETWPAGIEKKNLVTKEVEYTVDVEESQKVDYVISREPDDQGVFQGLIPEVIEDERVVLFSQFKAPLRELQRRIEKAGYRAVILDGEASSELREEIANDFDARYTSDRNDSKWDVVLCNYKVGGIGLNLTAATQMVILDEEWNPGKRDQAYDRIHRMGQEKPVTINLIRNQRTIDDWLANIMENKEGLVEGFNNEMVSDDDFRGFLENGGLTNE